MIWQFFCVSITLLYILYVVAFFIGSIPSSQSPRNTKKLYNKMPSVLKEHVAVAYFGELFNPRDREIANGLGKRGLLEPVNFPDSLRMYFKPDLPEENRTAAIAEYSRILEEQVDRERRNFLRDYLPYTLYYWIGPGVLFCVIGLGMAWVVKGAFR